MRAVFVSDMHLGHWRHNREAFEIFMEEVSREPPDLFVFVGDVYEMWVRDMSSLFLDPDVLRFNAWLYELKRKGVEIRAVVGNHDYRLRPRHVSEKYVPLVPRPELKLELDGLKVHVEHGHECEPGFNPASCEVLCLADDYKGAKLYSAWSKAVERTVVKFTPLRIRDVRPSRLRWTMEHLVDPGVLAKKPERVAVLESCLRRKAGQGVWVVYGHTHKPKLDEKRRIANTGAFFGEVASWVEVEDGRVRLRSLA